MAEETCGIAGALQDAAAAAADWIGQRRIAERELVVAVRVILMLARIATGLRKLPVDAGAPRPRHDRKDAVEHLASRKILVEPEMHQITKHAAALRDAKTQRVPDARALLRRQRIVSCFAPQERNNVADRGKADAHHDRIARAVDELVDRAAVEARLAWLRDLDMAVVDQTPRKTGRRDARITLALPHRQRRTVRVGNRIDERADEALLGQLLDVTVAEQPGVLSDELLPYHAGDTGDDRKARSQAIGARRHVTLPAAPHHGEAAPHQKPVAGMLGVSTVRRTVEPRHDRLVAAIGHVVD